MGSVNYIDDASSLLSAQAAQATDGRQRVSSLTPVFDGKVLFAEDTALFTSGGTGTAAWANQSVLLSVTAGQYMVRQSRQYFPYASGYPKVSEITFDRFQLQAGVIKRFGLFSSSTVAPYSDNYDGWYVESNGDDATYYLVVVNNGTEKLRLSIENWSGYKELANYDFSNFTVCLCDFLWLGGAALRLFFKVPGGGFVLAHQFDYAGTAQGVFMKSPNQPLRYEIRSTTGAGSFNSICSQVATEGAEIVTGKTASVFNLTPVTTNTVGTTYVIKAIRQQAGLLNAPHRISDFGMAITTADSGVALLLRNPTLSAALTWTNNGRIQEATGTTQTVTALGRVVASVPLNAAGAAYPLGNNSMAWMSSSIDGTPDVYVLAYTALTANQAVAGNISYLEY